MSKLNDFKYRIQHVTNLDKKELFLEENAFYQADVYEEYYKDLFYNLIMNYFLQLADPISEFQKKTLFVVPKLEITHNNMAFIFGKTILEDPITSHLYIVEPVPPLLPCKTFQPHETIIVGIRAVDITHYHNKIYVTIECSSFKKDTEEILYTNNKIYSITIKMNEDSQPVPSNQKILPVLVEAIKEVEANFKEE